MTTFVIDAPLAIDLAGGGASIPPEHSLTAPTLLRSQALNGTAGRFSTISGGTSIRRNRVPCRHSALVDGPHTHARGMTWSLSEGAQRAKKDDSASPKLLGAVAEVASEEPR